MPTRAPLAGQYTDAETGFQYLRARYYDPATGQFLTRDPIEAVTRSAYGYVGGNPLNDVDPSGLFGVGQLVRIAIRTLARGRLYSRPESKGVYDPDGHYNFDTPAKEARRVRRWILPRESTGRACLFRAAAERVPSGSCNGDSEAYTRRVDLR